jgi:hypothetical protein
VNSVGQLLEGRISPLQKTPYLDENCGIFLRDARIGLHFINERIKRERVKVL